MILTHLDFECLNENEIKFVNKNIFEVYNINIDAKSKDE
ncbi:hypothetical protein JCM19302_3624 [Jejuia pallidilutea]|uniref:Uncharacterized protein n=1 Tax=Jejuia pallidilutea TaxID=504487 RepID=A0A090W5X9_9FLAO|nr:hypothetical protein JCM19302_3624 [Jejuia pallidilutea]